MTGREKQEMAKRKQREINRRNEVMNRCTKKMVGAVLALTAMAGITGCAGKNVGGNWQCPLAQGAVCASVSAVDPAVPAKAGATHPTGAVPLYRPHAEGGGTAGNSGTEPATEAGKKCGRCGLFPFRWLGRLFSSTSHAGELSMPDDAGPEGSTEPSGDPAASDFSMPPPAGEEPNGVDEKNEKMGTRVTRKVVPEDAREPEKIGRVWIGPFVDADGVYREASWVRIVIEPASWRLP